jgi:hypothetical protein
MLELIAPAAETALFGRIFARVKIAARMKRRVSGKKDIGGGAVGESQNRTQEKTYTCFHFSFIS